MSGAVVAVRTLRTAVHITKYAADERYDLADYRVVPNSDFPTKESAMTISNQCPNCKAPVLPADTHCPVCRAALNAPLGASVTYGTSRAETYAVSSREVVITDIQMPIASMVTFMVKWAIASIPALCILFFIGLIFGVIFGGCFAAFR